jgi:hypothetical protein
VENYNGDDFESEIISGVEMHKRLPGIGAHEHKLNLRVMDATELVDPVEPILRNRLTRSGIQEVHLAPDAYQKMAEDVTGVESADGSDSVSCPPYWARVKPEAKGGGGRKP